jgi:hypothetical protein
MIDAIAYAYMLVFAIVSVTAAVNIIRDRSGNINLVINTKHLPTQLNFVDEMCGEFIWSPTFGCYFGGNDLFIALLGGGLSGVKPETGERILLVSDRLDLGVQMAILAHERGHGVLGHRKETGWTYFCNEVLADQYACHEIGRLNYLSLMSGHFVALQRDITFLTRWDAVKFFVIQRTRLVLCYLMP